MTTCPGCLGATFDELDPADRSYVQLRCRTCETEALMMDRRPAPELYEAYYASDAAQRISGPFDRLWRAFRRAKADRILRHAPVPARVLDVGCERGELLNVLKHRGCEVAGTQISASAATFARQRFGINVFVGELDEAPFRPGSFDVVLMLNVLEHLADPERYVRIVACLTRADGTFWIELPNPMSFTARLTRKRWLHADPEHHFWAFSRQGLAQLLARHGWRVEAIHDWSWEHGPIGCVQSWLNWLPGPRNVLFGMIVSGVRVRLMPLQLAHAALAFVLLLPALILSAIESAGGNGQVMLIRARRV